MSEHENSSYAHSVLLPNNLQAGGKSSSYGRFRAVLLMFTTCLFLVVSPGKSYLKSDLSARIKENKSTTKPTKSAVIFIHVYEEVSPLHQEIPTGGSLWHLIRDKVIVVLLVRAGNDPFFSYGWLEAIIKKGAFLSTMDQMYC